MWRCKQRPPLSHWCETLVRTSRDLSISHETDINGHCFTSLHCFFASKIGNQRGGLSLATCLKYASTFSHLQRLVRSNMFKTILCTYTYINSIKSQTWKVLVLSDFLWLNLRQSLVAFMDSFEAQMAPSGRLKVLWSKKLRRARFNLFFASCQNASRMYRCHVNLKIEDVSFKILFVGPDSMSKASNQTETVLRRLASLLCTTKKRTDVIKVKDETWWDVSSLLKMDLFSLLFRLQDNLEFIYMIFECAPWVLNKCAWF